MRRRRRAFPVVPVMDRDISALKVKPGCIFQEYREELSPTSSFSLQILSKPGPLVEKYFSFQKVSFLFLEFGSNKNPMCDPSSSTALLPLSSFSPLVFGWGAKRSLVNKREKNEKVKNVRNEGPLQSYEVGKELGREGEEEREEEKRREEKRREEKRREEKRREEKRREEKRREERVGYSGAVMEGNFTPGIPQEDLYF
ncbi:hypothetical protein HGM15179_004152 [Zosterops borbonicus]|uniref:Uncharacterized protein n=1 Tax=Zosterops borbonicus TaxID=364589 RepID=A0A8K1LR19_9PASS|nr:hypothetical protein HGM15179_004152 [Zosterops borbonicus]